MDEGILILGIALVLGIIYFLPTIVAAFRKSSNFIWVFLVNICVGFTLLGWFIALVMALKDEPVEIVENKA